MSKKKIRRIDKPAWQVTIERLQKDLKDEKTEHAKTRNEKNAEIERVWRLVPGYKINLMGVYPALRELFHILAEAVDLQDPSRGAPIEDTMRVDFVPDEYRIMSSTERAALLSHRQHRANVAEISRQLESLTERLSRLIAGIPTEYHPPEGECEECGRLLFQNGTGRLRTYCSARCRKRASRNVTKQEPAESIGSR